MVERVVSSAVDVVDAAAESWGISSVGRARAQHARGRGFDFHILHGWLFEGSCSCDNIIFVLFATTSGIAKQVEPDQGSVVTSSMSVRLRCHCSLCNFNIRTVWPPDDTDQQGQTTHR